MVIAAVASADIDINDDEQFQTATESQLQLHSGAKESGNPDFQVNFYDILSKKNQDARDLKVSALNSSSSDGCRTLSPPTSFVKSLTPPAVRRLKSSLKLSKSFSTTSIATTTSSTGSSQKNVRFAVDLTTVKNFDSNAEPISISNENSPSLKPIIDLSDLQDNRTDLCYEDDLYNGYSDDQGNDDGFWFNQLPTLKTLRNVSYLKKRPLNRTDFSGTRNHFRSNSWSHNQPGNHNYQNNNNNNNDNRNTLSNFRLDSYFDYDHTNDHYYDYDSDSDSNSGSDADSNSDYNSDSNSHSDGDNTGTFISNDNSNDCDIDNNQKHNHNEENTTKLFEILEWKLISSNIFSFKRKTFNPFVSKVNFSNNSNLEGQIFEFLQGSNIKLHSLKQSKEKNGSICGLIFVNNLNFEKSIEIKFSFNNWKDIHYVSANFSKSITSNIDEFSFVFDLNSLKYALKVKNLIFANKKLSKTFCPLNLEFCCRYDVNNETFYDNNNYQNYQIKLVAATKPTWETKRFEKSQTCAKSKSNLSSSCVDDLNAIHNDNINNEKVDDGDSFARNFLVSTTLSHNHNNFYPNKTNSRRFNEETDYYNTSPLKHLYHNDTTLIKPVRLNQVLNNPDINSTDEEENIVLKAKIVIPPNSVKTETDNTKKIEASEIKADENRNPVLITERNYNTRSGSLSSLDSCSSSYSTTSSSSSGNYSPFEDLNFSNYNQPYESLSSIDLNHFNHLPPLSNLNDYSNSNSNEIFYDAVQNDTIVNSHDDLYDDRQSVVTDVVEDQNNYMNNSNETLINSNFKPLSIGSITHDSGIDINIPRGSPTIFQQPETSKEQSYKLPANGNQDQNKDQNQNLNINLNLKGQKEIDYQSFLSACCFHASPLKKKFGNDKYASTSMLPLDSPPHKRTLPLNICNNDYKKNFSSSRSHNLDLLSSSPPILSQGSHWSL
ncbi:hypothetical protein HG535_0G02470 [Zygotorulaspora mrakii]|uniref:CBM21 domain-containing protein n=1 Tax=Zygotorulaspora mrakii TaxID=42260 RepID=A0A7H9B787_ZYGMR|nr:uncharacterized protein HG535_0G02470 [Zygotorulaspora mrakii]QLG74363.1 hypothetical protein HG535_0G02470 [Zygotorulaspora mrakii]